MQELLRVAIEVTVFALMLAVGFDCTGASLRRSVTRPWLIGTVSLVQFVCIPPIVLGVVSLLDTPTGLAAGLLLIAACPSGAISNTYTFLARGNSSLSVTLTTASCLVALGATPAALWLLDTLAGVELRGTLTLPWQPLTKQLLVSMALPLALGLGFRRWLPAFADRVRRWSRLLSATLLLGLVALIVLTDPSEVARHLASIWLPGLTVSVCLFALAGAIGVAFRLPPGDRIAILFELPCRNLAIAALIGLSVLARPELVYIATAFFLIEAVLLLLIAGVFAARQGRLSSMPPFRPRGERG